MKNLTKAVSIAILAAAPLATSIQTVHARDGAFEEVHRLNYRGFHKCKSLGASGYKAEVTGFSFDGPGGGNFTTGGFQFRVNTCFESQAQCEKFIDNIHRHVSSIERVYYRSCSSLG